MPVGMCVTRTALSVVFTYCPPAPVARTASIRSSPGSNTTYRTHIYIRIPHTLTVAMIIQNPRPFVRDIQFFLELGANLIFLRIGAVFIYKK